MPEYKMSFWNYLPLPEKLRAQRKDAGFWKDHAVEDFVKDWKDMGMNFPMTFSYDGNGEADKKMLLECLDLCEKYGLKAIVDDIRANSWIYFTKGEEEYRKGLKQAIEDFGKHPAVYAFCIGDEPSINKLSEVAKICRIYKEYAGNVHGYLNLLPYWDNSDGSFTESSGCKNSAEYSALLSKFLKESGLDILSYDFYGQCSYTDREKYIGIYYENLKAFGDAARENNAELWVCPLSVGHMSVKTPDESEIRWQICTAAASGASGFAWFYMYTRFYDQPFENAPYDLRMRRTQTYEYLSRQCYTFNEYLAPALADYQFVWAKHYGKVYGAFEEFQSDENMKGFRCVINEVPFIITKFENKDGEIAYAVTNNSQTLPSYIEVNISGKLGEGTAKFWVLPGQMRIISKKFWA